MALTIRHGTIADAHACGQINYEAFKAIAEEHGFPPDFPSPEVAIGLCSRLLSHSGIHGVVAELDGTIVGSNFLDERSATIGGIGPISVSPSVQNGTIGRQLMQAVLDRASDKQFPGVRLVQTAYHNRSLCLYTKLGFRTREPLSVMQGPPIASQLAGAVRSAIASDAPACNQLCQRVHGHDRAGELEDAIRHAAARVVERQGHITGYTTQVAFFGHSVGETTDDLKALIMAAPDFAGPGFLVPTRNYELFRWCLDQRLRQVMQMTLMTIGVYNEPAGAYLPSILY